MQRSIYSLLFVFTLLFGCAKREAKVQALKPSSSKIRIVGRVKESQDSVTIFWSGTSVLARFSGSTLKAKIKDEHGKNYFNIIIDGDSLRYIKLDSIRDDYLLASNLKSGVHTVELIKRNEWDTGATWLYSLETDGEFLDLPEKNKRVIEFFGNSITAGYAIEDQSDKDDPNGINTNSYPTYGAITARYFKADAYFTVKSGIGIMISWFPLIMPEMYNRLDPEDSLSKWDFKKVVPDIVVIDLFQNDSWLINMPDHPSFKLRFGDKAPNEKTIVEAYEAFVQKVRSAYPETHIICTLGSMDATRENSPWPGYVQQAVNQLHDSNVYVHFFPFMEKGGHPRVKDNAKMAESLIAFINKNIDW